MAGRCYQYSVYLYYLAIADHAHKTKMEDHLSQQIQQINAMIAQTVNQPDGRQWLGAFLTPSITALPDTVVLPKEKPIAGLLHFVLRYIELAPEYIEAMARHSKSAGIECYTHAFLQIACDFFLVSPEIMAQQEQTHQLLFLMYSAYNTHRLLEEVNDRIIGRCGKTFLPMDTAVANVIVHSLVGEQFANELDLASHFATEVLTSTEAVFRSAAFKEYLAAINHTSPQGPTNWPCLAQTCSLGLRLGLPGVRSHD